MKISVFIFLGFLLILSMFSVTTYINFQLGEQVDENSTWLARSTVVVRQSNRFQRNLLNMVSGLRGYLLSGELYFIQAYDSAAMENKEILVELRHQMPRESIQINALNQIEDLNKDWITNFAKPLIEAKRNSTDSDSSLVAFNKIYKERLNTGAEVRMNNRLQNKLRNFINYEYSLRELRKEALDQSIQDTRQTSVLLTSFSIITGVFIAAFLAYRISTRIVHMVKMADTIASGNYEVNLNDSGKDELSKLAKSLNHMSKVLSENIALLKRKNQELDQFAHIVSHDMKAPLRGIDNVVTWIEEDHFHELSPKVKDYIELIKGRLIRAENLIRGILSYSRIGKEEIEKEEVDVNLLLYEIYETISIKDSVKIQIQPGFPVLITERIPLTQIFSNLINNAVKYHDKPNGIIKLYSFEHTDHYTFFVEDNGPGIAKNYHNKIFVIFQTLNEANSFESTGVGLAIVKKILEDRKQHIKLISEPGKGSIFSFTWPKA